MDPQPFKMRKIQSSQSSSYQQNQSQPIQHNQIQAPSLNQRTITFGPIQSNQINSSTQTTQIYPTTQMLYHQQNQYQQSQQKELPQQNHQQNQYKTQQNQYQHQPKNKLQNHDIFSSIDIKCKCGQPVFLYCSSKGCYQHAIICKQQESDCYQRHPNCQSLFLAKNLHKNINSKIIKNNIQIQKFLNQLQKTIDQIVDQLSQMNHKIQKQMQTFGLTQNEYKLTQTILKYYDKQSPQKIPTQGIFGRRDDLAGNVFKCYNDQSQRASQQNRFNDSINRFKDVIKSSQKQIDLYFQQINELVTQIHAKHDQHYSFTKYFQQTKIFNQQLQPQQRNNPNNLSQITNQIQLTEAPQSSQLKNLITMLNKNFQFNSVRKIYTFEKKLLIGNVFGSQNINPNPNTFNRNKLIKSLEGRCNLLFLVKNVKNKIFGFFTPCKFNSNESNWIKQKQLNTFIFSLNLNICQSLTNRNFGLKYDAKENKIQIGQYCQTDNRQPNLTHKNGAKIILNKHNSYAELFLQKGITQINNDLFIKKNQSKTTLQINYQKIHGAERFANVFATAGPFIQLVEIFEINITKFKNNPNNQSLFSHVKPEFQSFNPSQFSKSQQPQQQSSTNPFSQQQQQQQPHQQPNLFKTSKRTSIIPQQNIFNSMPTSKSNIFG